MSELDTVTHTVENMEGMVKDMRKTVRKMKPKAKAKTKPRTKTKTQTKAHAVQQSALAKLFSTNLMALRTKQGKSQAEVAKAAKLSISYVSMLERGARSGTLETVEVMAKVFGVAPAKLLS